MDRSILRRLKVVAQLLQLERIRMQFLEFRERFVSIRKSALAERRSRRFQTPVDPALTRSLLESRPPFSRYKRWSTLDRLNGGDEIRLPGELGPSGGHRHAIKLFAQRQSGGVFRIKIQRLRDQSPCEVAITGCRVGVSGTECIMKSLPLLARLHRGRRTAS